MKGIRVITVFIVLISVTSAFLYPCEPGCALSTCTKYGCNQCKPGFCTRNIQWLSPFEPYTMKICVEDCGSGSTCNSNGICQP